MRYNRQTEDIMVKRIKEIVAENGEAINRKADGIGAYLMRYLETSASEPTINIVYDFCEKYGCSIDYLLGRTDVFSVLGGAKNEN